MRIFFLLLTFLLAACSKRQEEARSLVHEIPATTVQAALQMADSANVQCADPAACPESVGLFLGANPSSLSSCTAFLVAEDTVATNSHCLPSAVKLLPDLCAERVRVVFPKTAKFSAETFACESLILQSERPNEISPDLALFRVKKTGRSALTAAQAGVKPNNHFLAYKMNPGPGASGTIVAQRCLSVPASYRFPLYRNESDPVFLTGDCPSVPGNSGAPLVNNEGKAVGLFQAELALDESQKREWGPYMEAGTEFSPLALGTSLICLEGERLSERCGPIDPELIERPSIQNFLEEMEPRIDRMAPYLTHEIFRWKTTTSRRRLLETEFTLEPACFQPADGWLENFRVSQSEPAYLPEARLEIRLPKIRAAMRFNRYMQSSARVSFGEWEKRDFVIHPQQFAETGMDGELGICPSQE